MTNPDVDYHLARTQALLQLAPEPTSTLEILIAAQTHALVAHLLKTEEVEGKPIAPMHSTGVPATTRSIIAQWAADTYVPSYTSPELAVAFRMMEKAIGPDWPQRKIHAIKEIRASLPGLGLKQCKDIVEDAEYVGAWWR